MDYDDNDFQSQNLQLAGEGSTKFPPALSPYVLSKFDFDESLQGNLRLDGLVETQVFLGIESNDDNQWIDDFSRGSSVIQFSTSEAEPCSISRRDNVWKEATSSESVEMLLKSVGQEELTPCETMERPDACDELARLAKQMEPSLRHDDKVIFNMENITNLGPPDETHGQFPLDNKLDGSESLVEVQQSHDESIDENLSDINRNPRCGNVIERITTGEENFNDPISEQIGVLDYKVMTVKPLGDKSTDVVQSINIESSGKDVSSSYASLSYRSIEHDAICTIDGQHIFQKESDKKDDGFQVLRRDINTDNQSMEGNMSGSDVHHISDSVCSASKLESLDVGITIDIGTGNVEESSHIESGDKLHEVDRCNQHLCYVNPTVRSTDDGAANEDISICDKPELNAYYSSKVATEVDTTDHLPDCPEVEPRRDPVEDLYNQSNSSKVGDLSSHVCQLHSDKAVDAVSSVDDKIYKVGEVNRGDCHALSSIAVGPSEYSKVSETTEPCEHAALNQDGDKQGILEGMPVDGLNSTDLSSSRRTECHPSLVHNNDGPVSSDIADVTANDVSDTETMNISLPCGDGLTGLHIADRNVKTDALLGPTNMVSAKICANVTLKEAGGSTSAASLEQETSSRHYEPQSSQPYDTVGQVLGKTSGHPHLVTSTQMAEESEPQAIADAVSQNVKDVDVSPDLPEAMVKQDDGVQNFVKEQEKHIEEKDNENGSLKISGVEEISSNEENHNQPLVSSSLALNGPGVKEAVPVSQDEACLTIVVSNSESVEEISSNEENHNQPLVSSTLAQHGPGVNETVPASQNEACPMIVVSNSDDGTLKDSAVVGGSHLELLETRIASATPDEMTSIPITNDSGRSSCGQNVLGSESIVRDATDVLEDPKENVSSADQNRFSFKVNPSEEFSKDVDQNRQSLPATAANKIAESSPTPTSSGRRKPRKTIEKSVGSLLAAEGDVARSTSRKAPDRKRRSTGKAGGKESSKKGSHSQDTTLARILEKEDKANGASLPPSAIFQFIQSNEVQYGYGEGSNRKPFPFINVSTSSAPDLNSLASTSVIFQQPFSDFQQVQLRAQIFVYGALIQGVVPDEAHMISAFGGLDGGRSIWENAWHACSERLHSQKSQSINPETPLQPRTAKSALQDKCASSSVGRANNQATPATLSPLIPLSSPVWSIPTPCDSLQSSILPRGLHTDYQQTLPPLHPYKNPSIRSIVGQSPSWMSQTPLLGPRINYQTAASASNVHLSSPIVADTVKLTPVKGSSLGTYSSIKNVIPGSTSVGLIDSGIVGCSPFDTNNATIPLGQSASDSKSRKRKKNLFNEGNALLSQKQLVVSTPATEGHVPATGTMTSHVGNLSKAIPDNSVFSASLLSTIDSHKVDQSVDRSALPKESLNKLKEARTYAEEAAAFSASAVSHCQDVWSQLDKHKNSGLEADIETTLASTAVTIAAAVAVAKAAAAAANAASNAACQAKLMADEALTSAHGNGAYLTSSVNNLENAAQASILEGANAVTDNSSSTIFVAKHVAKRRVEATSAAAKRAENMNVIVKAAELAAEAVSQASKIVAMGDPLPLSNLAEAGPEGYWKVTQSLSEVVKMPNDMTRRQQCIGDVEDGTVDAQKNNQLPPVARNEKHPVDRDVNREVIKDQPRVADGKTGSSTVKGKNVRGPTGQKVSGISKSVAMVTESEDEPGISSIAADDYEMLPGNIKEGSLVEVLRTGERFKAAWFTANVITVVDGKVYVCYTELQTDDGSGQVKEWVPLGVGGDKPPILRVARPITGLQYEGTRKRRRAAMGDYTWSVGDRVDAWIHESWWEGVVTEKNKKDETSVTVHFPAEGETSVVRVWHLRPSLIWKERKWIEWSRLPEDERASHEGDTPNEKRPRLGSPSLDAKGKDKLTKVTVTTDQVNPDDLRLLDLAENERVFNMGKFNRNEKKIDLQRTVRSGLKKEGSKVVFGVPKPGKKRKFMEVSKHYVADKSNKNNSADGSVKFSNYLMSHGNGSRGIKDASKSDTNEKHVTGVKPKTLKPGKQQSFSSRTVPERDINRSRLPDDLLDTAGKMKTSANHSEAEATTERASSSDDPPLNKSLSAKPERANRGKLAPAIGKLAKIEEEKTLNDNMGKAASEIIEPRRSNRKIQPTSRLLEGLQSSLTISKIPTASHDKGNKKQSRHAYRESRQWQPPSLDFSCNA